MRTSKLEEYDLAGVPLSVIIDLVQRQGRVVPRLLGYRQTPGVYTVLAPDARGWLWIEPLKIWLGATAETVVCYDEAGTALSDYTAIKTALDSAEQRIRELKAELRRLG